MSGHFTDREERRWQRQAEEPVARPLPIGACPVVGTPLVIPEGGRRPRVPGPQTKG